MAKLSKATLQKNPFCVYCGGNSFGASVDHAPPIAMFDERWRPQGGEVTACHLCHEGTRELDAVASFFCRAYPAPTTEAQKEDLERAVRAIARDFPNLVQELGPPIDDDKYGLGGGFLRGGPISQYALSAFGARLAYALHFSVTGNIIPVMGGVVAFPYHTMDIIEDRLPDEFLSVLGPDMTLKQGAKGVSDQYSYACGASSDERIFGYWASFRKSVGFTMFVAPSTRHLRRYRKFFHRPGFLKGLSVKGLPQGTIFDEFETEGNGTGFLGSWP